MAHTQQQLETPIKIQYGHDGKRVLVGFSQPLQGHALTPDQCRAMIGSLTGTLQELEHYVATNGGSAKCP